MSPTAIRKTLAVGAVSLLAFCSAAQAGLPENDVYPKPQHVTQTGALVDATKLAPFSGVPALKTALVPAFKAAEIRPTGTLAIGIEKGEKAVAAEFSRNKIEDVPGAYFLKVGESKIEIFAKDDAGVFYAAQTLARMVETDGKLGVCEIADWPDVPFRGTVEGYYGRVWSHKARLSQLRFYGKYKMNTYIYAPKDDPYHRTRWREPYPNDEAKKFKELLKVAKDNHVFFTWAIHLGEGFNKNDSANEFRRMEEKFESMYKLGVRAFAILFDDFGGADSAFHVEAANRAAAWSKAKGDCAPLVICPFQYTKRWSGGNYLDVLAEKLDPSVNIMWTGDSVCSDITADAITWANNRLKRNVYVWWNWPVVDYCASALLLGRTYGLAKENKGRYSGFVSNPMDKPEASKIALFGVSDYTWNIDAFDSQKSWKDGIRRLFPHYAKSMQTLANHSSDTGGNVHLFRREESVAFKPTVDKAREEFAEKGKISAATAKELSAEFEKMQHASAKLVKAVPADNEELWTEIEFWARTLGETGKFGEAVTKLLAASGDTKKKLELSAKAAAAFCDRDEMSKNQRAHAEKIGAPQTNPCEVGSLVVMPFLTETFLADWARTAEAFTGKKNPNAKTTHEVPEGERYSAWSDDSRLKKLSAARSQTQFVMLGAIYEKIALAPHKHIGITLAEGVPAAGIYIKLDSAAAVRAGTIEFSVDGKKWTKQAARISGDVLQATFAPAKKIRHVRFVNSSSREISFRISSFAVVVPAEAHGNAVASLYDGDPLTAYTVTSTETFDVPAGARGVYVLSDAPAGTPNISVANGKVTVKATPKAPIRIFEILRK